MQVWTLKTAKGWEQDPSLWTGFAARENEKKLVAARELAEWGLDPAAEPVHRLKTS